MNCLNIYDGYLEFLPYPLEISLATHFVGPPLGPVQRDLYSCTLLYLNISYYVHESLRRNFVALCNTVNIYALIDADTKKVRLITAEYNLLFKIRTTTRYNIDTCVYIDYADNCYPN